MTDLSNATRDFLGDESLWSSVQVELNDVQALWGGRRIHVDGGRQVVVQIVQPGGHERGYELGLEPDAWRRLVDLLVEQDLVTIKPMERLGIPDEARPTITLINAAGEKVVVSKWARVKDQRFDAIYAALISLETLAKTAYPGI